MISIVDQRMSARGFTHLILAGIPRITSRVSAALPRHLASELVDSVPAPGREKVSLVVEATLSSFIEQEQQESVSMVMRLRDELYTGGLAVIGSARHSESHKVRKAVELVRAREPGLCVDGELQVDVALSKDLQDAVFPFCELKGAANVLVFPNLSAGLIASKLVTRLGQAESIGPLVLGLSKPLAALTHWCDVEEVVNTTTIMAIECLDGTL